MRVGWTGRAPRKPIAIIAYTLVAMVVSLIVVTVGSTAIAETPTQPKYGGILRIAIPSDSVTLDPALLTTNSDIFVTQQVYEGLVRKKTDFTLEPQLAVSWLSNEDTTSWTFNLRRDVRFHSGKEFSAEDVVFTFDRLLDPNVPSPLRSQLKSVKDVAIVDKYTVRFDLTEPNGFLPDTLSQFQAQILDSGVDTSRLTTNVDGTGPFILNEFLAGQRAVFKRNPDYWGKPLPYLDEVVMFYMPGSETRLESLKSGDVDVVYPFSATDARAVKGVDLVKTSEVASPAYLDLAMDVTQSPFDNRKVRQAFQAATDRQSVLQVATLGSGVIGADIPIPQNDPHFSPEVKVPSYDLQRARQLLTEAGYPNGIEVTLHTSDVIPGHVEMALAFKESAASAGITVNIQKHPEEVYWADIWLQKAFKTVNWVGRNPNDALSVVLSCGAAWNESHYCNPEVDALIKRAAGQKDVESRRGTYLQIHRILVDDVPRIITVFTPVFMGLRDNVQGLSAHPGQAMFLDKTWLGE